MQILYVERTSTITKWRESSKAKRGGEEGLLKAERGVLLPVGRDSQPTLTSREIDDELGVRLERKKIICPRTLRKKFRK